MCAPAHAADQQTGEPSVPLFLVLPDGRTRLAAVAVPNGMALDHDGPTLIVAEMVGRRLTAIDVADDGKLSGRRVFADLGNRKPDGICADSSGAGRFGSPLTSEFVLVQKGGDVADTITMPGTCGLLHAGRHGRQDVVVRYGRSNVGRIPAGRRRGAIEMRHQGDEVSASTARKGS